MGHAVGVHDPSHDLRIGVNIRRGNVFVRPDQRRNLVCVAPRQPFKFVVRELVRVANNAAFCASEWDVDDGAFPGHPCCEGPYFVERDVGMIANAALARPTRAVMLHAEAFKHANGTVVHLHRKGQR